MLFYRLPAWIGGTLVLLIALAGATSPAHAQSPPIVSTQADTEQARLRAQREAAEREARQRAPVADLGGAQVPTLGEFPQEKQCFTLNEIRVEGAGHSRLRWVQPYLASFVGRCAGSAGLDYILRGLQAQFLDRGLVTTRAGLPEQNLSSGVLSVLVVPGFVGDVEVNGEARSFQWDVASPVDEGDILDLRALEQGLEQMRRIAGRDVSVDLVPGDAPGETTLAVSSEQSKYITGSIGINSFAGDAVGDWQANAQLAAVNVLGASEILSVSYNRRLFGPDLPGDSEGYFGSLSFPLGWWTFGVSGSANDYSQTVEGAVQDFDTSGRLRTVSGFAERVVARSQISRTALRGSLTRRWARNFIEDVEIGIQRQDITDLTVGVLDRRFFGAVEVNGSLSGRFGLGILGAQEEPDSRPDALPSARYRIASLDIAARVPLSRSGFFANWNSILNAQYSARNLFGADAISLGGPFTVRGLDPDEALIGRSGFLTRQEVEGRLGEHLSPTAFFDFGTVNGEELIAGAGIGLRVAWQGLRLNSFAAIPIKRANFQEDDVRFGLSASWGF